MPVYTKSKLIKKIEDAANNMAVFYQQDFTNYRGKTTDTDEYYTEVVAQWCCDHISYFDQIPQITRKSTYKMSTHLGVYNPNSPRKEEITAMQMFNYCNEFHGQYDYIGKIIDYQTPLKNKQTDEAGKVDLLAYDGAYLRLLELKKPVTNETMLRCVLEGYTYLETVDQEKLLRNFGLPAKTAIVACPFVFKGEKSAPYQEMQEDRPCLRHLMKLLNCKPYYISQENDLFIVTEE